MVGFALATGVWVFLISPRFEKEAILQKDRNDE
jgi:hypothetical protein